MIRTRIFQALLIMGLFWSVDAHAQCSGQFGSGGLCGNSGATSGLPGQTTLFANINRVCGTPGTGSFPYLGASALQCLVPGTTGLPLVSAGPGVVPTYSVLTVPGGGTGLATGTSGGVPYFSSTTTMASSAVLTANQIVIGGGAGVAPASLGSLGTTTTVLHGNAAGPPTFGAVSLTTDVSGILPPANGGTGVNNAARTITLGGSLTTVGAFTASFTFTGNTAVTFPTSGTLATTGGASIPTIAQGDLLYGSAANVLSALAKDTNATRYLSNTGASNNPAWAQINLANGVTGTLPVANGGTNCAVASGTCLDNVTAFSSTGIMSRTGAGTYTFSTISTLIDAIGSTRGSVLYRGASGWAALTPGASGTVLTSNGVGTDPSYIAAAGSGTVTSVTITAGTAITSSGTCTSTTVITCTINVDKATAANYYAATSNKVPTTDIIYPSEVTVTYGTTTTVDFDTLINGVVTLTGNITTLTLTNVRAGKAGSLRFIQDGTGSRTWPAGGNTIFKYAGGTLPSLTTTANAIDVLSYQCQTTTYCTASLLKNVKNP